MDSSLKEGRREDISGQESMQGDICLNTEYELEHGCDVLDESLKKTNQDVFRPEASFVDKLKYEEVGQMCKDLKIDAKDSTEENKRILKQRLFSGMRNPSFGLEIKNVHNKTVQNYKGLKAELVEHYSDIITTTENESFKMIMSEVTELRFPHYEEELRSIKTVLQKMTEEFEIVVSGETSSGKSTFLNVLLGEKILPSHHLHTTASLCRLRNCEKRRIECIVENKNRTIENIPLTGDSTELRTTLELITKKYLSQDGDKEPLKAIDIYWPISSLHENIVLVDTPGIGERDSLTKQVLEYVPKSAGHIFIIDSSRAGGVQDCGIGNLIKAIAESTSKEDRIKDLRNAIFVCNKWDTVPVHEREAVLADTTRKIRKYCGQLEDWQIVQFNANLELKLLEWKANPTDDFKTLLKSLETLMVRTIETRLRDKYRWLCTIVVELSEMVKVWLSAVEQSKEKGQLEMDKPQKDLDQAKNKLKLCKELESLIAKEDKLLLQALEEYLKDAEVQRQHFDWTNSSPEKSQMAKDGPRLISTRLKDVIFEWATSQTGPLEQASDKCRRMQVRIGVAESPIWISVGIVDLMLGLPRVLVSDINRSFHGKESKVEQMTKLTEKAIDILLSENRLQRFINFIFTNPHSGSLTKLSKDTECTIQSTSAWILRMEREIHIKNDTLQRLKTLHQMLNKCSNRLQEMEKGHLRATFGSYPRASGF